MGFSPCCRGGERERSDAPSSRGAGAVGCWLMVGLLREIRACVGRTAVRSDVLLHIEQCAVNRRGRRCCLGSSTCAKHGRTMGVTLKMSSAPMAASRGVLLWMLVWSVVRACRRTVEELPEVVVTATRTQTHAEDATTSVSVISGKEIDAARPGDGGRCAARRAGHGRHRVRLARPDHLRDHPRVEPGSGPGAARRRRREHADRRAIRLCQPDDRQPRPHRDPARRRRRALRLRGHRRRGERPHAARRRPVPPPGQRRGRQRLHAA